MRPDWPSSATARCKCTLETAGSSPASHFSNGNFASKPPSAMRRCIRQRRPTRFNSPVRSARRFVPGYVAWVSSKRTRVSVRSIVSLGDPLKRSGSITQRSSPPSRNASRFSSPTILKEPGNRRPRFFACEAAPSAAVPVRPINSLRVKFFFWARIASWRARRRLRLSLRRRISHP